MNKKLTCKSDNEGNITIVLPAIILKNYIETADDFEEAEVVDLIKFAKDFARVLIEDEQEDGTNHLHLAFDSAFSQFSEGHQFSEGLDWND